MLTEYLEFLRSMAVAHRGLPHIQPVTVEKFTTSVSPADLYQAIKSSIDPKQFCVLIETPELTTRTNRANAYYTYVKGGVELIRTTAGNNDVVVRAIQDDAATLLSDWARRMIYLHSRRQFPLGQLDTDAPMTTRLLHDRDSYLAGARLEFDYYYPVACHQYDATQWD